MRRSPLLRRMSWLSVLPVAAVSLLYAAPQPRPGPHTIAFGRIGPYQTALFVSNADGGEEHRLLESTGLDYNPAWSPDGQWIGFTSEREGSADLYRVRPEGTGLERLTDSPAYDDQAAFSPDGRQVVFVTTRADGTADVWMLDLRTRRARPLTSGPGGDFRPSWSPDGQWVAFSSDRGSTLPRAKGKGCAVVGPLAGCEHLSDPSRRLGAQAAVGARQLLWQSEMDARQPPRRCLLHVS